MSVTPALRGGSRICSFIEPGMAKLGCKANLGRVDHGHLTGPWGGGVLPLPPHPHTLDLSAQHCELCCLRPFCASLSGLCSLPLGSPEEGRVTAQDRLSGVLGLGEPDEAQLGWNSCRSHVPALTVLSGRSCSVMSARAQQQALGAVEGRVSPRSKQGGPAPLQAGQMGTRVVGQMGHVGRRLPGSTPAGPPALLLH